MAFEFDLMKMADNAFRAVEGAAENAGQAMGRGFDRIDKMMANEDDSSEKEDSRQGYVLDTDEVIIASSDDAIWVSFDEECLDELVLTNKRVICVWEVSGGLFKPAITKTHSFRLEGVKTWNGEPAVEKVKFEGCQCLQIQLADSVEYFSFDESPKKMADRWANEIRRACLDLRLNDDAPKCRDADFEKSESGDECTSDGSEDDPDGPGLAYSLMLEQSLSRGSFSTKTDFFVLDGLGRKRYLIECINYEKARKDNHAILYDAVGEELGQIETKERMKGQPDDEYLIDLEGDGNQYHLRIAYLWERPKGKRITSNVYLLKPNGWLAIESIKEKLESLKAKFRGEELKAPMRIWDKDELVMQITRGVSERGNLCHEIEVREKSHLLLGMMIAVATSGVLDHSEER